MNIQGLTGEASDAEHSGWLDIEDLEWGVCRRITSNTSTANDRESSNAAISDLTIRRRMDSATPSLFIESCCGRGRNITIHLTKTGAGSGADTFMAYEMRNAIVAGYEVAVDGESERRPIEKIEISFVDLEVKYTPYDEDGTPMAAIAVGFDTATNTKR